MVRSITATVPPFIEHLDYTPSLALMSATESALIAIAQADTDAAPQSTALGRFMIRAESVACSKIARITASAEGFTRAIAGDRSNASIASSRRA